MNKFKKPYSSRPSYGSARLRTGSPRNARNEGIAFQKFDAICSNCGKKCQVPFRPNDKKPVYCKDCFDMPRKAMTGKRKFSTAATPRFSSSANFNSAASVTPVTGGKSIADLTRQIAAMNTKIDTMLKILTEGGGEEE